jgi:hypothetical protein
MPHCMDVLVVADVSLINLLHALAQAPGFKWEEGEQALQAVDLTFAARGSKTGAACVLRCARARGGHMQWPDGQAGRSGAKGLAGLEGVGGKEQAHAATRRGVVDQHP